MEVTWFLENQEATNEVLLVFDYSCLWCKKWMDEVLLELEENWINIDSVKFLMGIMVYLNDASLRLSNFDQSLKRYYSNMYYEISREVMKEAENQEEEACTWRTAEYINETILFMSMERKYKICLV
ncbi:thioredoxin domain-containing protein [Paraliobacillus sp. JSM ZJ581]|uniref:thioredoxin domain-containing protein n=1 Tax=Paraliobacillus sp. JSM ZJ581 TaxID=3342118 RepID=UPI0035A8D822